MTRILAFLAVLWPAAAFAQDDTAEPPADTAEAIIEDTGGVLELPADTVIKLADEDIKLLEVNLAFPLEAPDLARAIHTLSYGSHIVLLDEDGTRTAFVLPEKYWLMPDSYYREAVTKAKQLDIYVDALERCTTRTLAWQQKTSDAYDSCLTQFDSDEELISTQVQTIATWETKAYGYKDQRDTARRQRNVAYAVTGGLVLGAATVIVVAIAP